MKLLRTVATILLLLFVVATVGTLIAQEVGRPEQAVIADNEPASSLESDSLAATEPLPSENETQLNELPEVDDVALTDSADSDIPTTSDGPIPDAMETADATCIVEAVYFHNTHRCVTCLKIEGDAKAIVEDEFAEELAAGVLQWSAINMEDNPSQSVEYGLASPSLVLLRKRGDQVIEWVVLEETWALVRSTTRYSAYITDRFSRFLEGCL